MRHIVCDYEFKMDIISDLASLGNRSKPHSWFNLCDHSAPVTGARKECRSIKFVLQPMKFIITTATIFIYKYVQKSVDFCPRSNLRGLLFQNTKQRLF